MCWVCSEGFRFFHKFVLVSAPSSKLFLVDLAAHQSHFFPQTNTNLFWTGLFEHSHFSFLGLRFTVPGDSALPFSGLRFTFVGADLPFLGLTFSVLGL